MRAEAPVEGSDASMGAHLRQAARSRRKDPEKFVTAQLEIGELPWELERLWEVFTSLCGSRARGFAGEPISLSDIDAWCRLYGVRLHPWEVDGLRRLDRVAMKVMSDAQRKQQRQQGR